MALEFLIKMNDRVYFWKKKRRPVKNNAEKYKTLHKEISKNCDEAKEKWINVKCRNIEIYCGSTEQTIYKNIEEISGKKTCSSAGCFMPTNGDIIVEKENILDWWTKNISEFFEDHRKGL